MRFRKSINIFKGVRMNVSKSGVSFTVGRKGVSANIGKEGVFLNTGLPGTGLYDRRKLVDFKGSAKPQKASPASRTDPAVEAELARAESLTDAFVNIGAQACDLPRDWSEQELALPPSDEAVEAANEAVYARSTTDKKLEGMGTTVVAATVQKGCLYIANVGDSRLYILDEEEIVQITRDHSLVEEMVRAGQLAREKARNHPEKNVITSAVGMKTKPRIDCFDAALYPGDIFLMCSDGLTNMLEDEQILRIVQAKESLPEAAQKLIDEANHNGGSDNISVILATPDEREV